jgi:NADH-quinone oxidoreductase subunit J
MVLFIFIIMLLDLNDEKSIKFRSSSVVAGIVIPLLLVAQVLGVIQTGSQGGQNDFQEITTDSMKKSAEYFVQIDEDKEALPREEQSAIYKSLTHEKSPKLPDTNLIGHTIFKSYNYPLQVMGALLLVATIGVVILSKRSNKQAPADS